MGSRSILHHYADPLESIWLAAARQLGWNVVRASDCYAAWDGRGTLTLAQPDDLDPDDTVAQMVFHEMCHALVAGPFDGRRVDWGLDNTTDRDEVKEHACNRVQAALATPYGLREFLAVTTDFREYYDALPEDPLVDGTDPAIALAQLAHQRSERAPFRAVLHSALERTAQLGALVRDDSEPTSLWRTIRLRHSSGLLLPRCSPEPPTSCGECAWSYSATEGADVDRSRDAERNQPVLCCRQTQTVDHPGTIVAADEPGCERWEARFDETECARCGACCHRGFDLVMVDAADRFLEHHPELVTRTSLGLQLARPDGRCPALHGEGTRDRPYRCRWYTERPTACADFAVRGSACLVARRRVGMVFADAERGCQPDGE